MQASPLKLVLCFDIERYVIWESLLSWEPDCGRLASSSAQARDRPPSGIDGSERTADGGKPKHAGKFMEHPTDLARYRPDAWAWAWRELRPVVRSIPRDIRLCDVRARASAKWWWWWLVSGERDVIPRRSASAAAAAYRWCPHPHHHVSTAGPAADRTGCELFVTVNVTLPWASPVRRRYSRVYSGACFAPSPCGGGTPATDRRAKRGAQIWSGVPGASWPLYPHVPSAHRGVQLWLWAVHCSFFR